MSDSAVERVRGALELAPDHATLTAFWSYQIPEDVVEGDERDLPLTVADLRAVLARLAECEADAVRLYDILMQVSKVTPGESRHESAKRIIRQHEDVCSQSGPVAAREGVGHG